MSLITSKQLIDALVVVKSEQSKDECHNNLTMSLEKAKGRKYEKITTVSLVEINENGVIKKIMFPAPAGAVSDVTNIPNATTSRAKSSRSRTKASQSASKTSNQSNMSCNTTPLLSIAPNPSLVQNFAILPRASNQPPQNVVNVPLQMNQTNPVNNKPLILNNMSNSSGLQSPQTIIVRNSQPNSCNFNMNNNTNQMMMQQSQVMLQQQPPIIIQQPLMNPGLQQNVVYQSPGSQQVIHIQGNSFQSNNSGQCWVQNQFIPSQNGQQQFVQVSNNLNNNTAVQYQIVNPQRNYIEQSSLNVATNSNPPIFIQPQPLSNAIVISPNNQRTVYINQPNGLTSQIQDHSNIQQQPNIITVNSNKNNMNNIKSNQMIIQVNNNNAPQPVQQSMLQNKISNIVYSMQTQTVTNPMVISNANITMPANNYASQKLRMVEIRPSNENSPANAPEKDVNTKVAIPRLNKTTSNQVNKTFKCKKVGGAVRNNPPEKPRLNVIAPVSDEPNVGSKANLKVNLFNEEKTDQDDVHSGGFKLNVESQLNGSINNDDVKCTLESPSKNVSPTNNNQGSSPHINSSSNNNKTSLNNKNAPFILFNNLSAAPQKQSMENEAKRLEAMKSYRQIRPKPTTATTPTTPPAATTINKQLNENSELVKEDNDNSKNGENLNDKIPAKRKKLAIVENDLAIAQMLSNEDDSDSEGDFEDCGRSIQRARKGRKTMSTDKSYKCKNSVSQGSLRHYPRTRSSTKMNKH
ncbi:hypothetical protein HELRODRAFT_182366 [Helobdella robusta]|uniref:Uncharacterized protein n=1 Tax=Helobdella robusta TaxID=6412 RepID=T1FI39_HELRO|nr:hypothetical protein HELRODRAFT_182366 [Helobdella robusta]ESN91019.1 hypothetical protein HELRODRAFT_182366 [Helobdella robusta]